MFAYVTQRHLQNLPFFFLQNTKIFENIYIFFFYEIYYFKMLKWSFCVTYFSNQFLKKINLIFQSIIDQNMFSYFQCY